VPMCPPDASDSAPSELSGATARLAFTALEASSVGSETEGGTSMAGMPIGPSDHRQGQTFQNKDGALFDVKDYDGKGGGIFALSEKDVNRNVLIAAPSELSGVLADEAADEADDEMPALEESDDDEPLGPRMADQPLIALPPGVVQVMVYCTSCHQDVTPVHYNYCPECSITDAAVGLHSAIAEACRTANVVNHQKALPTELRDAIQRNVTKKLLARMKVEESAEPEAGGLPPRPSVSLRWSRRP
jgi:hypothetical protein